MKIVNCEDVSANELALEGAKGADVRLLIGTDDGPPNFIMLMIGLAPGGCTPDHHHEWEEEILVKAGQGKIRTAGGEHALRPGDVLFLDPNMPHQFINTGAEKMEFICVIPKRS